jgi:hypothetical protein
VRNFAVWIGVECKDWVLSPQLRLGICSDSPEQDEEEGGSTSGIKACHGYSLQKGRILIRNNQHFGKEGWNK